MVSKGGGNSLIIHFFICKFRKNVCPPPLLSAWKYMNIHEFWRRKFDIKSTTVILIIYIYIEFHDSNLSSGYKWWLQLTMLSVNFELSNFNFKKSLRYARQIFKNLFWHQRKLLFRLFGKKPTMPKCSSKFTLYKDIFIFKYIVILYYISFLLNEMYEMYEINHMACSE